MTYTLTETGDVLTETYEGITLPVNYSFKSINDFIHQSGVTYEELETLCLGMAEHIDKLQRGEFICIKCGIRKNGTDANVGNF